MIWDGKNDTLNIAATKEMLGEEDVRTLTKRMVLSNTSKIFDPLGFLEPFTVRAKIMLQKLWESSVKSDDILSSDQTKEWKDWMKLISQ